MNANVVKVVQDVHVHLFIRLAELPQLVERSPRTWSVVASNPTQGSFFFEKKRKLS